MSPPIAVPWSRRKTLGLIPFHRFAQIPAGRRLRRTGLPCCLAWIKKLVAAREELAQARETIGYLARKAPWFQIKEDRQAAATSVYVILRVVDNLKTILAPILPHTAQKLHEYLGYDGQLFGTQHVVEYQEATRSHAALTYDHSGALGTWTPSQLPPGQALRKPAPLFKKLDESLIDEQYAWLE